VSDAGERVCLRQPARLILIAVPVSSQCFQFAVIQIMSPTSLLYSARLLVLLSAFLTGSAVAQSQQDESQLHQSQGHDVQGHPSGTHRAATSGHVDAHAGGGHDAAAHRPGPDYDESTALALSQEAVGRNVGDYSFLDGKGQTIALHTLRGKPVVVSLIYTSCYHICPTVTSNLAKLVEAAREALGKDSFSVLTIGFDTANDTPDRMRVFAAQRGIDIDDWHFVSATAETMRSLSADLGFSYFASPKGFDHMIQATVLDASGTVYRQIYGIAPELPLLVEPLKEILWGKQVAATPVSGWINNIKLFCTVFDPTTGKYRFDLSPFISFAIGILILSALAWVIVRAWRESSSSGPAA
jgi:protein SCO1